MTEFGNREDSGQHGEASLLRDFRLLLYLFIGFRLMMLVVYQPMIIDDVERGVTAGGDMRYYYALGAFSDEGLLPFRDFWSEFPPVWPTLYVAAYRLTALGGGPNYTAFASLMGLLMLAFDTGNLILLRRIGARLYGPDVGLALAWVYAVLLAPAVFLWWTFETMLAFWLLLSVWWLLYRRDDRSAAAALIGGLTKFVPLLMLGAVWRFRDWRSALRYTLIAVGGFALIYAVVIAATGLMGAVSLWAQSSKSSYGTVWALIDGNYTTGVFGTLQSHFDPAEASRPLHNPAVIPGWLRLIAFGGFGLYAFWQTRRRDDRAVVMFVTLTLLVFFLWAQGWSPQWLALIIPLVLLSFPGRDGVLAILLLSMVVFTEYPLLFIRTGDTGGMITGALLPGFVALVLARTAILVGLVGALFLRLRRPVVTVE